MTTLSRLMTADEAFSYCVNRYPSLYASLDERSTRMAVYDQLFNVLGNGYRDLDDLVENFTWTPELATMAAGVPAKYMGPEPVFEGFTALAKGPRSEGAHPDFDSRIRGYYTEAEKEMYPDVKLWVLREKGEGIGFYPNFKPEYSLLYRVDRNALDSTWLEAGLYFYRAAKDYFNSADADHYSRAWPSDPKEQARRTSEMDRDMRGMSEEKKAERWATLSSNYGVVYKGSTAQFLQDHWAQEKARIAGFIDATIEMLETELSSRAAPAPGF